MLQVAVRSEGEANVKGPEKESAAENKGREMEQKPEVKSEQRKEQKKFVPKKKHSISPNAILIRQVPAELNKISSIDGYFSK